MPSQSREGYFPRARGGVYPKSDPIVAGATRCGFLFTSCSTTKNLPEGAVLYTGIKKIEVKNEDKTKPGEAALEEVEAALAIPPTTPCWEAPRSGCPSPSACGSTTLS